MVANHYGETGEYGDFGELLSNHQISSIHGGQPHITSMFTLHLCNIYAGLKNNRLYTLSEIDNMKTGFSGVKLSMGTL